MSTETMFDRALGEAVSEAMETIRAAQSGRLMESRGLYPPHYLRRIVLKAYGVPESAIWPSRLHNGRKPTARRRKAKR